MSGVPDTSSSQLSRLLESQRDLMAHACPVMHHMGKQTCGREGILMLADPEGIVLCSLGDDAFAERAARVALRAGANWHERWRGTNAIGTVIATGCHVAVDGLEHYLSRHAFLSCAAAPIRSPRGHLAAILNVSGQRGRLPVEVLSLVRRAARHIEHRLFLSAFNTGIIVRLHPLREALGTGNEGLMALSEEGIVTGANEVAVSLLRLNASDIGMTPVESLFGMSLTAITASAGGLILPVHPTRSQGEAAMFGQIQVGHRRVHRNPT